ncbi:hypothetical protein [Prauserella cavernicola]|uniref:Uncharacterized protein n=1 Tax=Prauserella cavernicola TaxID=2800127 RepID=A0A934V4N5_9PSEU|nr:hypothetical protein [Prauserella cavernicola]MBK1784285.1 hypothetical protein [Prauserella cavernicola]
MTPERFASVEAYNAANPDCPMPTEPSRRNCLRGYHAAMRGVADDVAGTEATLTIDFLPGGAPGPDEPDRTGTVVATRWGDGPVLVLADDTPLREAWKAITRQWPTRLSEVQGVLASAPTPVASRGHAG